MIKWRENRSTWSEKCDDKTTLSGLVGLLSRGDIILDDLRPQNGFWVQGPDDGQTRGDFSLLLLEDIEESFCTKELIERMDRILDADYHKANINEVTAEAVH